jgi:hypothetical protein
MFANILQKPNSWYRQAMQRTVYSVDALDCAIPRVGLFHRDTHIWILDFVTQGLHQAFYGFSRPFLIKSY